jgi:hypothetical protein
MYVYIYGKREKKRENERKSVSMSLEECILLGVSLIWCLMCGVRSQFKNKKDVVIKK